ncbi:hypothetical protein J7E79_29470 [Bacillus sp. ISL-40]|uniref:hypothetical protein n=1 Tax=unclassified Bacillus (in: firmicutes) TaxID=185979 RepID=UPI001BE9B9DA|nr:MULTISPECIES: hypothetical protein [unclassified Bacillus (in: firmicutes)]MBT2701389.1 hypothetical protein [Bacillus sp. ISL-40]MBT2743642.1 hypothetical protein [Bacillus sp. ISL-77]
MEGPDIIFHIIFVVVYIILCFALFGILDRVKANKLKALKSELERNIDEDDEQLSNKEKVLLNKTVFWSRIRVGVGIIMFIGLLLIILYK